MQRGVEPLLLIEKLRREPIADMTAYDRTSAA